MQTAQNIDEALTHRWADVKAKVEELQKNLLKAKRHHHRNVLTLRWWWR